MSLTSYRAAPPRGYAACVVLCAAMACCLACVGNCVRRPGGDRLSRTLRCSIMGAGGFHVRVRDGIGWGAAAMATRSSDAITYPLLRVHAACACAAAGVGFWCSGLRPACVCWAVGVLACGVGFAPPATLDQQGVGRTLPGDDCCAGWAVWLGAVRAIRTS